MPHTDEHQSADQGDLPVRRAAQLSAFTTRPEEVDGELVDQVASMGFEGVICHFGLDVTDSGITWQDPRAADLSAVARAGDALRAGGLEPLSTWGYWANLVSTDPEARAAAIEQVGAAADVAAALECPYVVTGSGSNAAGSAWQPHPDNHGPDAIKRLTEAFAAAVELVAARGAQLVLKPHVLTTVRSTDLVGEIMDAIDTPDLRVGFDPVNLVRLEDVYGARDLMEANISAGRGRIGHAHVKDFVLRSEPVTQIAEVPVGQGQLDLPYFLRLAGQHAQGGWVIVEHLQREQLPDAVTSLRAAARP